MTWADPSLTLDQVAALAASLPARAVTVTLGAEGALVVERGRPGRTVHVSALPVLAGACAAIASVVGIPRLRALPLATVLFFFASIAGALFARGSAYPGRFSVHVIPVTCALSACAAAALTQTGRRLPS